MARSVLITAIIVGICPSVRAAYPRDSGAIRSLVGITEVYPSIAMSDVARQLGLDKYSIQTAIELRLRKFGLKISERPKPNCPDLMIIVHAKAETEQNVMYYGVVLTCSLIQTVVLERDSNIRIPIETWEAPLMDFEWTIVERRGELQTKLKELSDEAIDAFLNDYLKANPRD